MKKKIQRTKKDLKRQGDCAELAFMHEAMKRGFNVARLFGDNSRADVFTEKRRVVNRVQIKSGSHGTGNIFSVCVAPTPKQAYTMRDIDFLAAYIVPIATWYIIPVHEITHMRGITLPGPHYPRRHHFDPYREAWHLLARPPRRRVTKFRHIGRPRLDAARPGLRRPKPVPPLRSARPKGRPRPAQE